MTKKWMVDDAGTLINMETRDTYDYMEDIVDKLNEQEEKNMQLRNQIKIFELFLDSNNLDIEWDLFCTNEDDASCQECVYLGISDGDVK